MMIRKQNCNAQPGRRKEQRSSNSIEENGNRTEETQHGQSQSPPHIGDGQENGKKIEQTNPMEPRGDEGSGVVFHIHQRKELRENYKRVYKLWRETQWRELIWMQRQC